MEITILKNKTHPHIIERKYPCLLEYKYVGINGSNIWSDSIVLALDQNHGVLLKGNKALDVNKVPLGTLLSNQEYHLNCQWTEFIGTIELTGLPGPRPDVITPESSTRKLEPEL